MKKATKIWLITAGALVLAGIIIFAGAMAALGRSFSVQGETMLETAKEEYEITDSFDSLSISADEDDIQLIPSDSEACRVVCYGRENSQHTVQVKDHTLEIGTQGAEKWYEHLSLFSVGSPKITVYLPKEKYGSLLIAGGTGDVDIPKDFGFGSIEITASTGDVKCAASSDGAVKISVSTGDIHLKDVSADAMELHASTGMIEAASVSCKGDIAAGVSTGEVLLSGVACGNLTSDGSTGDIELKDTVAAGLISVTRSTGDVRLVDSDAGELLIKTSTGDVTGTLLSEKVFITDTSTGDVSVPKTVLGGKCGITTNTGDIYISLKE